jgi:hypothetical protein
LTHQFAYVEKGAAREGGQPGRSLIIIIIMLQGPLQTQ